ncbi:hypothetical protein [Streptomyces sp. MUM 16J]|uniref:hypothetical protein n=1 Tax=Streptomyces sp. MUM 16J TaxID=2791988 RepID=UPI001F045B33|nr:hypothetical protein [Streptomyces sp. MUM 16J]MCH0557564.1 hypothetical protein [Streptomyces sp. MUM 16J]
MTQSGQGEEPSARSAREGVVLPSDGSEPLLPGATAAPAPGAPTGAQSWGGSWGSEQQSTQPGQGWPPAAAQQWETHGAPDQRPPSAVNPGPLPPEGAPAPSYGGQLPPPAGQDFSHGHGGQGAPYGDGGHGDAYGGGRQPGYGAPDPYQGHEQYPQQYPAQPAPLLPTAEGATQYLPPVQAAPAEGATQYLPPVQAAPAEGATQYLPPVQAAPAEGATQYIPPVAPAHSDAEATQYIPPYAARAQVQAPGQALSQGQDLGRGQGGGQGEDADRQPPAEFNNLFRNGPTDGGSQAGSTQQLPRIEQPEAYPGPAAQPSYGSAQPSYGAAQPSYGAPQSSYGPGEGAEEPRRGRSRVPLIATAGVAIVVLGVGAGALLSGGGKDGGNDGKAVAAVSPAAQGSASPAADPARQQAVALDKLLADSGSSRAAVIQAVAGVKRCDKLDQAASTLREAAKQRGQLVTRLGKLSVDKLPGHGDLTTALTKAWQASAAADNHYAAWADQVRTGHKGCHKGNARITGQTQAGNRESGTASAQKTKAAALWNTIAKKYGLTQRQTTQL